jgi:hypothetical protein
MHGILAKRCIGMKRKNENHNAIRMVCVYVSVPVPVSVIHLKEEMII